MSVTEEAQILPIPDGSGKYLLKSDGFYCLNPDGTKDKKKAVHYFDHFAIDGTEFNGYYYHDESGKFRAENPHMVRIKNYAMPSNTESEEEESLVFDGCYMVNNLGRLSAAPQVRYMNELTLDGVSYNGYYYFNENGRLVTETGIHSLKMSSNGQFFDGDYYFGGTNGVLVQEEGVTEEGFPVDKTGKVNVKGLGMKNLKPRLKEMMGEYEGEWSVYVKDLETDKEIVINDKPLYSASLIKAFVMAGTYENMETVKESQGARLKAAADSDVVSVKVGDLLENMITVSDNESFNELVRLQTNSYDFKDGAHALNKFLKKEDYPNTSVQHTLAPSASAPMGIGDNNTTSVKDCGKLLESIYRGTCVNKEASEAMLNLLLNQKVTVKIPSGLSEDVQVANKTGETNMDQHDIAIVYGEKTTYILCVMSENTVNVDTAIDNIRDISATVYSYLNL